MVDLKKYIHYQYGFILPKILTKHWFWFAEPFEVKGAAMANFFSYNLQDTPGFAVRSGLTTMIDLRQSLDDIWSKFRPNFIAKQIKKAEANGITIKVNDNFKDFIRLYRQFRQQAGLGADRLDVLQKSGILFTAYWQGKILAGGIFMANPDYMRALVLASGHHSGDGKERELIGQANRLLLWQAIKYAKASGRQYFDLGGISPQSTNLKLVSLAEFKEAFGGQRQKCYYYFKVYSPLIKWWMRLRGFKNI